MKRRLRPEEPVKETKAQGDVKFEFEAKTLETKRVFAQVKCVSARGLRDADWLEGTSDPYCLCEAIGKAGCIGRKRWRVKVKSKFKTKTVNNKENPASRSVFGTVA